MDESIDGSVIFQEEFVGDVLVMKMSGRLDALTSSHAEKRVFDSINQGQQKILLDFSGIDYLSSAGMRMLLSVAKKLKSLSGRLVIFGIVPNVMDILQMAGFDHVLDIVPTRKEGLQRF